MINSKISHEDILKLKRFNCPAIYNGLEQITKSTLADLVNQEELTDFMPNMGVVIGFAVTVVIQPGNPEHPKNNPNAWNEYREYVAGVPGPKVVIVQDLDKPGCAGAFWGEVNSNIHRSLGCIGTVTDGGIRDLDEMKNAGMKALARRLCIGHAFSTPVRWDCEVEVFGCRIKPQQLVCIDQHGFIVIPDEDQKDILEATRFMDENECNHVIPAARSGYGKSMEDVLAHFSQEAKAFGEKAKAKYGSKGEW